MFDFSQNPFMGFGQPPSIDPATWTNAQRDFAAAGLEAQLQMIRAFDNLLKEAERGAFDQMLRPMLMAWLTMVQQGYRQGGVAEQRKALQTAIESIEAALRHLRASDPTPGPEVGSEPNA